MADFGAHKHDENDLRIYKRGENEPFRNAMMEAAEALNLTTQIIAAVVKPGIEAGPDGLRLSDHYGVCTACLRNAHLAAEDLTRALEAAIKITAEDKGVDKSAL